MPAKIVMDAIAFATNAHNGQFRKDGVTPFITHPHMVHNEYLFYFGTDDVCETVSILHDVIEDTNFSYDDIKDKFGCDVAAMVDALTRPKGHSKKDYYRHLSNCNDDIKHIKLCDRLSNLKDTYYLVDKNKSDDNVDFARYYVRDTLDMLNALNCPQGMLITKKICELIGHIAAKVY